MDDRYEPRRMFDRQRISISSPQPAGSSRRRRHRIDHLEAQLTSTTQLEIAVSEIKYAALSMSSNNAIVDDVVASSSSAEERTLIDASPAAFIASGIHEDIKACLDNYNVHYPKQFVLNANMLLNIVSTVNPQEALQVRSALILIPSAINNARRLLLSVEGKGTLEIWDHYDQLVPLRVSLCMRLYPLLNIPIVDFFHSALYGFVHIGAAFTNPAYLVNLESGALTRFNNDTRKKVLLFAIEQENGTRRSIRGYLEWCLNDSNVLESVTRNVDSPELRKVAELLRGDLSGTSCIQHTLLDIVGNDLSPVLANAIVDNFDHNRSRFDGVSSQVLFCTHPDIFIRPPQSTPLSDDFKTRLLEKSIPCNIRYQDALSLRTNPSVVSSVAVYRLALVAARYGRLDILRLLSTSWSVLPYDRGTFYYLAQIARADIQYEIDEKGFLSDRPEVNPHPHDLFF